MERVGKGDGRRRRRRVHGRRWLLWMRVKYLPYRPVQRLMHRFNLHHLPPKRIEGDVLYWCHWCGLRVSERRLLDQEFPIR